MGESAEARVHRLEYLRQWRKDHPDYVRQKNRTYRISHRAELNTYERDYWRDHRQQQRQKSKRAYGKNRVCRLLQIKAYKHRNRAKIKISQAAYDKRTAPRKRLQTRAWLKAHPDYVRAANVRAKARRKNALVSTSSAANRIIRRWKSEGFFVCYYCQERFPVSKMHVDHILAMVRGGKHSPENICRACEMCNTRKREKPLRELVFLAQPMLEL